MRITFGNIVEVADDAIFIVVSIARYRNRTGAFGFNALVAGWLHVFVPEMLIKILNGIVGLVLIGFGIRNRSRLAGGSRVIGRFTRHE